MKVTKIENKRFKTVESAIFLTVPLKKETVTMNALIPAVLRRGTANLKTQLEINKKLENMYGAGFNCGIDKTGDYCILKFYIETINEEFVPRTENDSQSKKNIVQDSIDLLNEIIFNPLVKNDSFDEEYVEQEKENVRKIILSKKDNKSVYAYERCIEEMFENEPYGQYKYGTIDELEKINAKDLYEYYKQLIKECKIDLLINGENIKDINTPNITSKQISVEKSKHITRKNPKIVKEKLDVSQGKLIIGLDTPSENKFAVSMYNVILGGGANSKLFQNVREKASLAYSAGSSYLRRKNAIFIRTGIELCNYDKALEIIKQQLQEMKNGNITEEEIKAGRELILASIRNIKESQEDSIAYHFDQELYEENVSEEEYCKKIENITKEQIIDVANKITINTIYFLEK